MDIAAERAFPTPLANATLLPMLLLSLARQKHTPDTAKTISTEYDYVIVGAGSAGSVVASRLSEMPCVSVLLLEAGGPPPILTEVPGISRFFWNSNIDWKYRTAPQRYSGDILVNRQVVWPSGKTLGGSSVLNGMLYVRGNRRNYDDWAADGAEGWSYEDVLPYFKKMEDNRDPEFVANGYHGVHGPQTVHRPRYQAEIKHPILEAAKDMGYQVVDSNAARQTGFYDLQATMRSGQRCSTAKAYLVPAENRTNLDILPNAMVRKVLIKNNRAVGVRFDFGGTTYDVMARKEVIMSAGTVNTAQLLMLSGIGPRKELERFKIPIIADLPVGKNFQDHCGAPTFFELKPTIEPFLVKVTNPANIAQYMQNRTGPLGSAEFNSVLAFLKGGLVRPKKDFPSYELIFAESTSLLLPLVGVTPEATAQIYGPYLGRPTYGCLSQITQPRSRGTVTLRSTDPYDPPIIDPNYYEDPKDIEDVVEGLKVCLRIGTSAALRKVGSTPFQTLIPGCEKYAGDQDMYLWCVARSFVLTLSHPVGTAKMGHPEDPRTVVDPQLRVKHIKGLRVVDASVMPIVPSGNTNAPTIMVAEKASAIIKETIKCHGDAHDEGWGETEDSNFSDKPFPLYREFEPSAPQNSKHAVFKRDLSLSKWIDVPLPIDLERNKKRRLKNTAPKVTPWNKEIPHVAPWNKELLESSMLEDSSARNRSTPSTTSVNNPQVINQQTDASASNDANPFRSPQNPPDSPKPQISLSFQKNNGQKVKSLKLKNLEIQVTKTRPSLKSILNSNRPLQQPPRDSPAPPNAPADMTPPPNPVSNQQSQFLSQCDEAFCSSLLDFMQCQEGHSCGKKKQFASLIYGILCSY